MLISTHTNSVQKFSAPTTSPTEAQTTVPSQPQESFEFSGEKKTPTLLKAGKWALAGGVTAGVGAMGYYAGTQLGGLATLSGVASGAIVGGLTLGAVGIMADLAGGFMSNNNNSGKAAIAGGVIGGLVGGAAGAFSANPWVGATLAIAGGLSGFVGTAAATNILAN